MTRQTGLVPAMRYRDVPGTVDWLCKAFGCAPLRYGFDTDGRIMSAEVVFGSSPIAIGPVKGSAFDHLMVQPDRIGGVATQYSYIVVPDADAHCTRSKAAGAEIVLPPYDDGHGARLYACKDREGHLWTFGTYDPLDAGANKNVTSGLLARAARWGWSHAIPVTLTMGLVLAVAGGGLVMSDAYHARRALDVAEAARAQSEREARAAAQESGELSAKPQAEHAMRIKVEQDSARAVAKAQSEIETANRALAEERSKRELAQQSADEMRKQLAGERQAREALAASLEEAEKSIADERQERESSDRQVRALVEALMAEQAPRKIELATARTGLPGQDNVTAPSRAHVTAAAATTAEPWVLYQDPRSRFSFQYPSGRFLPDPSTVGDHGSAFVSRDGRAQILVYGGDNASGQSIEAYRQQLIAESFSDAKLDYVPVRKTWFVLSGKQGGEMFYVRISFACDGRTLHGWGLRYPTTERNVYDRIVEDIHRSYKQQNGACG